MSLGKKQRKFTRMVASLILWAYARGYEISLGDAYRDPRVFGKVGVKKGYGGKNSNHKQRLAIDLNLFKDGKYLTKTEDHRPLGEQWESMGGEWGGAKSSNGKSRNDGNHYSLRYNGRW